MHSDGDDGHQGVSTAEIVFRRLFGAVHTVWDVLGDALHNFGERHAAQAAAGMAYYAVFSLFPLLLFLITLGSVFVAAEEAQRQVYEFVNRVLPISQDIVIQNVQQVLENRRTVGAIAAVTLLWSALGFFTVLALQIDRAWHEAQPRTFIQGRLVALGMVVGLTVLLLVTIAANTLLRFIPSLGAPGFPEGLDLQPIVDLLVSQVLPLMLSFALFVVLYRQVPNVPVGWEEALWSAAIAAIVWRVATVSFVWYVSSFLVRYRLVYGSLGSFVALMFWIYLSSWIALFGAHLCAAIWRHKRNVRHRSQHG